LRVPPLSLQESCPLYPFCRVGSRQSQVNNHERGITSTTVLPKPT
jgi:hypothetical protein